MSGKKGTKVFTEEEFKTIKGLAGYGVPHSQIVKITGRAASTVSYSIASETFAEYRQKLADMRRPKPKNGVAPVNKQETSDNTELIKALTNINDSLTHILATQNTLVRDIEWIKEHTVQYKKGLFSR